VNDRFEEFARHRAQRHASVLGRADMAEEQTLVDTVSVTIGPSWTGVVDEVQYDMQRIESKVRELTSLHEQHLLSAFDDREEERKIESMTGEITALFHACQARIKELANLKKSAQTEEALLIKNVSRDFAGKLQTLSESFRAKQKVYLGRVQAKTMKEKQFNHLDDGSGTSISDVGFTDEQLVVVDNAQSRVTLNTQEIQHIHQSIVDLASIFNDMAMLVIDQGTILDRIDYNIENTYFTVDQGVKELESAIHYQKKTRSKLIIIVLLLIIVVALIAILVRVGIKII